MSGRYAAAAACILALVAAPAAWAAGKINNDPESRRLATECLLKAAEKLPKISGLSIVGDALDQHGDLFVGSFFVNAVHRQVYFDFQCLAAQVTITDLQGKATSAKRIDKLWMDLRIP
ncbi:hypothetical protein HL658_07510 [Azospirillum sp. RWY-5-1]|uniref:DUF2155 domain-containing protein n=1 Tax=Azospirillum oleiclasticum TaxID=2735135 RepID=A0ABX2T8M8_9PROT|nr:hypothetical protein [Azospirillum oleiclasticum]NYZ12392.1 hypothetical protein [Azospirillum oleiclasticum]NYZ19553.1 hypothetical protein [Azospirillum oleiclasticum]